LLGRADALLLTGGADVDPARYGQAPSGARDVDPRRDTVEIEALRRALDRRIPVLAICRGCQLLNVALGGTLWQDLATERGGLDHDRWRDGDGDVHPVRADGTSRLRDVLREGEDVVQNSAHHQGIRDLAPGLRAVAWASDGLVEAFEAVGAEGGWTVGVQWHPERKLGDGSGTNRRLFERLGAEARLTASGREGDAS
jgi:gamma-glutamyl-gamma-aminobutyrate hydrolase PuuD